MSTTSDIESTDYVIVGGGSAGSVGQQPFVGRPGHQGAGAGGGP